MALALQQCGGGFRWTHCMYAPPHMNGFVVTYKFCNCQEDWKVLDNVTHWLPLPPKPE